MLLLPVSLFEGGIPSQINYYHMVTMVILDGDRQPSMKKLETETMASRATTSAASGPKIKYTLETLPPELQKSTISV
jgi:hypothetical protein